MKNGSSVRNVRSFKMTITASRSHHPFVSFRSAHKLFSTCVVLLNVTKEGTEPL